MVAILLGKGFEEIEAIAPCDILRRGGVDVVFAGVDGLEITGGHGVSVKADVTVESLDTAKLEMIVVPGGLGGVQTIEGSKVALQKIREMWKNDKEVAAICAGPRVLSGLGILKGKKAVCYPGMENQMDCSGMTQEAPAVRDGRLATGRGPGAALDFGFLLLEVLKGKKTADQVAGDMYYQR